MHLSAAVFQKKGSHSEAYDIVCKASMSEQLLSHHRSRLSRKVKGYWSKVTAKSIRRYSCISKFTIESTDNEYKLVN